MDVKNRKLFKKLWQLLKSKMTFFLSSHTDLAVYFERYLPFLGTHLNLIYPSGFWSRQAASKQKKGMTRSNGYPLELPHCTLVDINRIFSFEKKLKMVFCYQYCSDLLWELIVLLIKNNFLRSLEQFIQTVKGQNNSW